MISILYILNGGGGDGSTRLLPRWERGEIPRKPNSRTMPLFLDQRLKMENVEPKIAFRSGCRTVAKEVSEILQMFGQRSALSTYDGVVPAFFNI